MFLTNLYIYRLYRFIILYHPGFCTNIVIPKPKQKQSKEKYSELQSVCLA